MSKRNNLSSARVQRQGWRAKHRRRAYQTVYDAADHLRHGVAVDIDASAFAKIWIGVGLQIAASVLEEAANELLCEDIVKGES